MPTRHRRLLRFVLVLVGLWALRRRRIDRALPGLEDWPRADTAPTPSP